MRKLLLTVVLGLTAWVSQAQTSSLKIGYADIEYIFSQMPDSKRIDAELKTLQTQLKNQIESKAQEFQKKLQDYQANINTMPEAVRANTERELQQLQQNLEKLQQDAQVNIQTKQNQLMDPVYKTVGKAIEDTAKENGFTYILNQQVGGLDVILYGDEKMNVSDLVLKKMGITPKPATAQNNPAPKQ